MKVALIGSGIGGLIVARKFVIKGDEVTVVEKKASLGGIPLCLANAKIVANEIPV